jgi:hypothetical protein
LDGTQPGVPCHIHAGSAPPPDQTLDGGENPTGGTQTPATNGTNEQNAEKNLVLVKVRICVDSGAKANAYCPDEKVEWRTFRKGEEPTEYCTVHGP